MAVSYLAKGTFASGTAAIAPGIPAGMAAGDLMILVVHSANQTITGPTGWTAAPAFTAHTGTAERGTAAAAGGVRVRVFARWWVSGDTAPSVADTGNLTAAIILGFRGVDPTTPFDGATPVGMNAAAATTLTLTGITTNTNNAMVVHATALDRDAASTTTVGAPTNANLTSLTERHDQTVSTATGGGVHIITGLKASAGASGNTTTAAGTSTAYASICFALREDPSQTLTQSARFDNTNTFYTHTLSIEGVTRTNRGAYGAGGTAFTSTSNTTVVLPAITPTDDSLLVVAFYFSGQDVFVLTDVTIADDQGLTWTAVTSVQSGTPGDDGNVQALKVWYAPVATAAATVVTVTHPDVAFAVARAMRMAHVLDFVDYDTADPIGGVITGVDLGSGPVNLTLSSAPDAKSEVVAICANVPSGSGSLTATPAAGWTEIYDTANPGYGHLQTQVRSGSTSDQVDWDDVAVGDTVYSDDSIALAFEVKYPSAGGAQGLTQSSRFDNTNTFYTHTLTPGAVTLTQSARFDDSDTFYTHALSKTVALAQSARFDNSATFYTHTLTATRALTQSARFDNTNTFYTHTLSTTRTLTQSSRFDNAPTFYTHVLTQGAVTLTQSARLENANTFYTHTLTPGAVTLTQSARFDNSNTFYTHVLSQGVILTQSARFDNTNTYYTHTLTTGAAALTQAARFDNAATFYTHALSAAYAITQSARFDDADTFYTHTLTPAYALTQSSRFDNTNTFYTHNLLTTRALTQSARFDNANGFYTHTITAGAVALTQASRFDNSNTFYAHVLNQAGGPQNLSQGTRLDNSNTFYAHTLTAGSVGLTQTSRLDNAATFYTHVLAAVTPLTQTVRFDDSDTFYTHTLAGGAEIGGLGGVTIVASVNRVEGVYLKSVSNDGVEDVPA